MMEIPASILLAVFVLVFLILMIMTAAHLYHGYRFGKHDSLTMTVNGVFVAAVAVIVVVTFLLLSPVDWTGSFSIAPSDWIGGGPTQNLQLPTNTFNIPSIFPSP